MRGILAQCLALTDQTNDSGCALTCRPRDAASSPGFTVTNLNTTKQ